MPLDIKMMINTQAPGSHLLTETIPQGLAPCSFGFVWLINRTFSANEQYVSLTLNQSTVLLTMAYHPNKPKRTGRKHIDQWGYISRQTHCA